MKSTLVVLFLCSFAWSNAQVANPKNGSTDKNPADCSIAEIDSLLDVFNTEKAYNKFLSYAQVGADKAAKQYGKQDTTYAKMLYFLGFGYQAKQDVANAEKYLKQAIDIQKIKKPTSPEYANSLHNLAILYKGIGDYVSAEPFYKESVKIRKAAVGKKHPDYAKSLNNLANFYMDIGSYALAESLSKEALQIRKEALGEKHSDYALSLNNLGILYWSMGSYALAEPLYKEALKIRKETLGEKHPMYAKSLNNLAVLYIDMHNYDLAEALSKEALRIKKETVGEKHPDYANSLTNLAILYKDMHNYTLSESLHKEALKIRKAAFGEKHPDYASSLYNLAFLYNEMGNDVLAEPLYKEFIQIYKEVFGERHPEYIGCLINLANLYNKMNRDALSWNYIQQSITANSGLAMSLQINQSWADSLASADYSSIKEMVRSLTAIRQQLIGDSLGQDAEKNKAAQIIVVNLALKLLQKKRNDFSDEADKLRTLSETSNWVLSGLAALSKTSNDAQDEAGETKSSLAEKAFALAEQSKAILLLNAAQTAMAQNFGDLPDSLGQKEQQLQKQKSNYEAGIAEKRPDSERDSLRNLLNNLNVEIKNFKTSVEKTFPKYAALKYQHKDVDIKEVQKLLNDNTALLEYVIGDSVVYIFYVDKNRSY